MTPFEFAEKWYKPDAIHAAIKRLRLNGDSHHRDKIPSDTGSLEFAQWLSEQYQHAMRKGIEIGTNAKEWKIEVKS